MENQQKSTNANLPTDENIVIPAAEPLTFAQQMFIDYRAINGLIVNDEGVRKMTLTELASQLSVDRTTLYLWQRTIPGFWDLVAARRKELASQNRLAKMQEVWDLKAMKGDWQFWNAWMINFNPEYVTPTQKVEHEIGGGLADLMKRVRAEQQPKVIDAEVTPPEPAS